MNPEPVTSKPSTVKKNRQKNKSLGYLTIQFVELMKIQRYGILDMRLAAEILCISQKRRIYDITNVLEGIGLIRKANKNCVQWCGFLDQDGKRTTTVRAQKLRMARNKIREDEIRLDMKIRLMKQNIRNTQACEINKSFSYITRDDLVNCYGSESVTIILKNVEKSFFRISEESPTTLPIHFLAGSGRELDVRLVSTESQTFLPKTEIKEEVLSDEEPSVYHESKGDNSNQGYQVTEEHTGLPSQTDDMKCSSPTNNNSCKYNENDSDSDDNTNALDRKQLAKILLKRLSIEGLSKFTTRRLSPPSIPYKPKGLNKKLDHSYCHDESNPFANDALMKIEPANECDYLFSLNSKYEGAIDLFDIKINEQDDPN